jgi:hypothetical protein
MAPAVSDAQRKAMFAATKGKSTLGIPRSVGQEFTKGLGPKPAAYAAGGPVIQESRSRFMKEPNQFRENVERQSYPKSGKTGELSNTTKDKSLPAIKPRA